MRLLILSFYFPPDLSAGSFRTKALVDALRRARPDAEIDVITTQPNRYRSHAQAVTEIEDIAGISITRIPLPAHSSGMVDQSRAFVHFARQVLRLTSRRRWSVVYATSSRLMTAALGALVSKRLRAPLYLDIRDLFTDTMRDVLAKSPARYILWPFDFVERWTFRSAGRVNLVSEGFLEHARTVAPCQSFRTFTNGIDPEFLTASFAKPVGLPTALPNILYAGNIGEGQGLQSILPDVAKRLEGRVRFTVIGDGGRRAALADALKVAGVNSVDLYGPVPRAQLFEHYAKADLLFLHLNNFPAFLKVLPSKIFEYAATGKPVLAGVGGYAAKFISENIAGSAVFAPCEVDGMVSAIDALLADPVATDREVFRKTYARESIMDRLAQDVLAVADCTGEVE
jgi:glycosyltransferase involved in cell wall biosynthesis